MYVLKLEYASRLQCSIGQYASAMSGMVALKAHLVKTSYYERFQSLKMWISGRHTRTCITRFTYLCIKCGRFCCHYRPLILMCSWYNVHAWLATTRYLLLVCSTVSIAHVHGGLQLEQIYCIVSSCHSTSLLYIKANYTIPVTCMYRFYSTCTW